MICEKCLDSGYYLDPKIVGYDNEGEPILEDNYKKCDKCNANNDNSSKR